MLPGPSGRPRHASLCGTAWAEVPGLCVQRYISARNCTYAACSAIAGLQISPSSPHLPSTQTSIPLDLSLHASLHFTPPVFLNFFLCVCVFMIGDALCAICSKPHHPHPPPPPPNYLPLFPLVTRVGLTICVPVCSHRERRGSLCGHGGGNGGCISRHIIKAQCAED